MVSWIIGFFLSCTSTNININDTINSQVEKQRLRQNRMDLYHENLRKAADINVTTTSAENGNNTRKNSPSRSRNSSNKSKSNSGDNSRSSKSREIAKMKGKRKNNERNKKMGRPQSPPVTRRRHTKRQTA